MSSATTSALPYPRAPRVDQIDDYGGVRVADPYRWLEDVGSPQVQAWISEENALTQAFLAAVPGREKIRVRLTELWNYERRSVPEKIGEHYAWFRNTGLQNQAVLYVTRDLAEPGRVLLDPNTFSPDGTVALSGASFSDDGSRLAYSVSSSGSDWQEWRVRDVASGRDLPDLVRWAKFSVAAWKHDGSGFWYARYDEPRAETQFKDATYYHKVYFHRLGTPQSTDVLVYERPDHKEWTFHTDATEDGQYLVVSANRGTEPENRVFVLVLNAGRRIVELLPDGDARWEFLGNDGTRFYFLSSKEAPRGRIVSVDLESRALAEIVPETSDVIEGAHLVGDRVVTMRLRDAVARVAVHRLDGTPLGEVAVPGLGTVAGFTGKRHDRETFYSFTSYSRPATIFRYDVESGRSTQVFSPPLRFDADAFVSEQVFYTSKDGTRIPMIITRRRDLQRDGEAPTILYGYGGFDVSLTPTFSSAVLVWLELGGVFAVANLRGGGEYGEAWHQAGVRQHKQNVFDDFFAAAEYLIAEKWTATPKLAIHGASNGGLLVGACVTQRPELFGAALPSVGVMDMLRFQRFTIGWAWASDYGSSDNPEDVRTLLAYSPYHNVRVGTRYPAMLISTGDHDDRVFPAHSFKFAAAVQYAQAGDAPILLRVDTKAGHGAGKPTAKIIDEVADRYTFLVATLKMPAP
ncbi:MAG TPA: prolyl oligopeptidase family serine peptidase [Candidatus Sulfotelmatobacter sp.]|nr:prolyl oligopeptidase family serine peptidase [Candidatus Sulfotelmatobacter sp.]